MLFLEAKKPLSICFPDGKIRLDPGHPMFFNEERALKILTKAKGKVKLIEESAIVSPVPKTLTPGWWITWQSDLKFRGPAQIEFVDHIKDGIWVLVFHRGTHKWISEVIITTYQGKGGERVRTKDREDETAEFVKRLKRIRSDIDYLVAEGENDDEDDDTVDDD